MLIVRGLVVAAGGLAFLFLPGVLISFLTRRDMRFETSSLLWGMGLFLVTLFPALFLATTISGIVTRRETPTLPQQYGLYLLQTALEALFLLGGLYLLLRWRKVAPEKLLDTAMLLGLGAGLMTDVFLGLGLVGAGFRLVFGDTSTQDLASIATQPWPNLATSLIALNVYRVALVAVTTALAALASRSLMAGGQRRWLWIAVAIHALVAWGYNAIGLALGSDALPAHLVAIVYEGALAALALFWLTRQMANLPREPEGKKRRRAAPAETS